MTHSSQPKVPLTDLQQARADDIAREMLRANREWVEHQAARSGTFNVSVPALPLSAEVFRAWLKPKMLVQGVVDRYASNGMGAIVKLHDGVNGFVHHTRASKNRDARLEDVLPLGLQVFAQVDEVGEDYVKLNTRSFTVPRARMAQVVDEEEMKARVLVILKTSAGVDISALVTLPDGMMGMLEARYFRNHKAFPLSRRLSVGQEIYVAADLSKGFNNDCIYVTPEPEQKAVYDRLQAIISTDPILTGVVSGRHSADGPYFVAIEGVLDGTLYPSALKTTPCGCSRCNTPHPEELEIGQEVQVRIAGMSENERGYVVLLSRKNVP